MAKNNEKSKKRDMKKLATQILVIVLAVMFVATGLISVIPAFFA